MDEKELYINFDEYIRHDNARIDSYLFALFISYS